jgi:phosphate:Na+ symporter
MTNIMLLSLFGGILLLLYGVNLAGEGLKGAGEKQIQGALRTLTRNRLTALLVGIIVTFLLQSSSATTVMLVSFVESGLLTLSQTLGIILGADIGTTLTVQLISFRIYDWALFIVGLGILLMFVGSRPERKSLGRGILGFGLIFLSIGLMSKALSPLRDNRLFEEILLGLGKSPLVGIIVSAAFTALIQSSAATIGIALTLSLQQLISLESAIVVILGANIGTCATAIIGSIRSQREAKQVATAHILFKVIGVLIMIPLIKPFTSLVELSAETLPRQIANAHTFFNLGIGILFLPFTGPLERIVRRLTPAEEEAEEEEKFRPKYLNPNMLKEPGLALAQATRETIRMSEIVQDMLCLSQKAFAENDLALIEKIENTDDKVDILDSSIRLYLTQLIRSVMNEDDAYRQMEILSVVSNLESIGDVIDKNLMELAKKKVKKEVEFSKQGWDEIQDFHAKVVENLELALSAFASRDLSLAQKVVRHKASLREIGQTYYENHILRLQQGLTESIETSSIHLDVLTNLRRINSFVTSIVFPLITKPPAMS